MDGLDNRQIILLTLLVSFITSIATGIVTVTLMEEAPAGFTRTVNQVVETTVEKIVPKETVVEVVREVKGESPATLIATVVEEREPALVKIVLSTEEIKDEKGNVTEKIKTVQAGFFISQNGLIATNEGSLEEGKEYRIVYDGKEEADVEVYFIQNGVALLGFIEPEEDAENAEKISNILSGADSVHYIPMAKKLPPLGSHVVALGNDITKGTTVQDGIISGYDKDEKEFVTLINSSIPKTAGGNGGPLMTLNGDLIGITSYTESGPVYYPMSDAAKLVKLYLEGDQLAEKENQNNGEASGQASVIEAIN